MIHLLTPAARLQDVTVACGSPSAARATWRREEVTCTHCLGARIVRDSVTRSTPPLLPTIRTEKQWQEEVRKASRAAGYLTYHTLHSAGSEPGFPDLVAVKEARLLCIELKMPGKGPTAAQQQWLSALAQVQTVECFLWYPGDLPTMLEVFQ